jgi:hypothetical protein
LCDLAKLHSVKPSFENYQQDLVNKNIVLEIVEHIFHDHAMQHDVLDTIYLDQAALDRIFSH